MLHKLKGIVLKTTDYSESSVVVQIFTDLFGTQSYLINGVKKPRAKISLNMLQPLHLLDLVAYHKASNQVQRVAELRTSPVFTSIPYDLVKRTIVIFLNEVLYKSIRGQDADQNLFDFIHHALCWLDGSGGQDQNFHLSFLLKLTGFLGFGPGGTGRGDHLYFDLQEGAFGSALPSHPYFLDEEDADLFLKLFRAKFDSLHELSISTTRRRAILGKILIYYQLHVAAFGEVKSHKILEEILS
ncbi:DNA repair protein RecO [Pedobacter yulinensis]|uniref:DNA repair protein RecO n=1 Tax=Pedobacter yulinensis TaxID=2126353 RepID=A0A2T3HNV1_9SPHI|nr:DNA repair protein RecO [Pedobacter yulinensis]PST84130.1 DNA repair protein RecO [Pedobacter yulinensis]